MVNIILEKNQEDNNRVNSILSGIMSIINYKKDIVNIVYNLNELLECNAVIVLGASFKWMYDIVSILNKKCIKVIIFGFEPLDILSKTNYVTIDYAYSMYQITKLILKKKKSDIVFFGFNKDSFSDKHKINGFNLAVEEENVGSKIYYNNGNISDTIKEFINDKVKYTNVICANDDLAIYFFSQVENPEIYNVGGYGGIQAAKYCLYEFITAKQDYTKFGLSLIELYYNVIKSNNNYVKNIIVNTEIFTSKTNTILKLSDEQDLPALKYNNIDYYKDKEIKYIDNLEKFILKLDESDKLILKLLLKGMTYNEISEKCFMAENTVKYRLNKMGKLLGTDNKKQLISFLQKYNIIF